MMRLKLREVKQLAKTQSKVSIQPTGVTQQPYSHHRAALPRGDTGGSSHTLGSTVDYTRKLHKQVLLSGRLTSIMSRVDVRGKRPEATDTPQGREKVLMQKSQVRGSLDREEAMEPMDARFHSPFRCFLILLQKASLPLLSLLST